MNEKRRWEHFSHQADIGIRGFGATMTDAFAAVAQALTAVVANPEAIRSKYRRKITCSADDPELLLYDWLNELVFEMSSCGMLFSSFDLRITGAYQLEAVIRGEPVSLVRHRPVVEVKGVTFTELAVRQDANGGWLAQAVVDV
ncbi:MAG: archease [Deltaproteobacteria bacterium]|nr:archease [Candidatus Anaeroferrophillus wilburensis]MBN2889843.1 archease [Deltaproteobacteria bacterium]